MMLTLEDAVAVTKRLVRDEMDSEEIIRQELEQKCYLAFAEKDMAQVLNGLIQDINKTEVCAQIATGTLDKWCETMRIQMTMALTQLMK